MVSLQEAAEKQDMKLLFMTAIVTSLVFVVGLFWNEAMKAAIESIFPSRDTVSFKFMAALFVTVIVSFVLFLLYRSMRFAEYAKKGVSAQVLKIRTDLNKRRKELDEKQRKIDRALKKSGRKL